MEDRPMTTQELATYLGVPVATVYAMNSKGTGPRRIRVGRYVRYLKVDVDRWIEMHAIDEVAG